MNGPLIAVVMVLGCLAYIAWVSWGAQSDASETAIGLAPFIGIEVITGLLCLAYGQSVVDTLWIVFLVGTISVLAWLESEVRDWSIRFFSRKEKD